MSLIRVDQRAADFSEMLQAAAVGEYWALEILAADCLPKLTAFAKARGANDPESLAGTVMMEFFGRLDQLQFDVAPQMWAYLYRILRSRLIDERRAHKPLEFHENQSIEILLPETSGFDEEVVDRHLVDDLLDRLTTEQREILEMRFLHDLSIEETASRTGRTQTAVKGLQRRAIRSLSTAAVILAVVAFGAGLWAIMNTDNPANTTTSSPAVDTADGGEGPLVVQGADDGEISASDELSPTTVSITDAPESSVELGPMTFEFSVKDGEEDGDDIGVTFECRIDAEAFSSCASPMTYSDLEPGSHVFLVRAVQEDGSGGSPALHVWTIQSPPNSDDDVVAGDQPNTTVQTSKDQSGNESNTSTAPTSSTASTTSAPKKSAKDLLRESPVVYKCANVTGTYSELEEKGYDVRIGGEGDNKINVSGGKKPDFVVTFGGNDSIITGGGDDLVCSGDGHDSIESGAGNDWVSGGGGNDTIDLGPGNDRSWSGSGNDTISGGIGNDILRGSTGTDTLNGDDGNDDLDGGAGLDSLVGGGGEDVCANGLAGVDGDQSCEKEPKPAS